MSASSEKKGGGKPAEARTVLTRRNAVIGVGAAGALGAAAVMLPGQSPGPVQAQGPAADAAPAQEGGYRLTEHIQRYYATARI
jgi:hypothetical protein